MCNDYETVIDWHKYRAAMEALGLGIPVKQSADDLPAMADVRVNDMAPVMRASGNVVELAAMRWSFPPAGLRGGPVFNFRSEGRRFANSNRCLIPASAFFEFTGKSYPKTKHRFTLKEAPFMAIAGLWRPGLGEEPPRFTMLTTEPGPDVAPIHDRQVVVLRPRDWSSWLSLAQPEAELLRPLPAGSLEVTIVRKSRE